MHEPSRSLILSILLSLATVAQLSADDAAAGFAAFCKQRAEDARTAGQAVVRGQEDWLFLSSELRHLGVGPFWGDAAQTASASTREDARDPLPAILDTARQLREKGIALLVVPVPPRAVVYADELWAEAPKTDAGMPLRLDTVLVEFYGLLRSNGVDVLDLTDAFLAARGADASAGPVYCRQDSHWSPRGAGIAAGAIAAWVTNKNVVAAGTLDATVTTGTSEISGDLWRLLEDASVPRERLPLYRVVGADKATVRSDPVSPVLVIADSHGLVFSAGGDMHAEGGGVGELLAAVLRQPVDVMARRGSAATAVRIDLARRIRAEADFATVKKVVVWCFAARELTESAGWRAVPLFP